MDILQTAQVGSIADMAQADTLRNATLKTDSDSSKLEDVAKKFEGMLLHEMFKQVQQSIDTLNEGDEDEDSSCREQYQSLYWSQLADAISERGGMGFWKTIYGQIRQQADKAENAGGLIDEGV